MGNIMARTSYNKSDQYPLTVFFDGDCPICRREISLMEWLNRKGKLRFVNFADPCYDETSYGFTRSELGRVIHAQWANGSVITELEVFRSMWAAVGLTVLTRLSRLSFLERMLIRAYKWFARNRLRLTGRTTPQYAGFTSMASPQSKECPRCVDENKRFS